MYCLLRESSLGMRALGTRALLLLEGTQHPTSQEADTRIRGEKSHENFPANKLRTPSKLSPQVLGKVLAQSWVPSEMKVTVLPSVAQDQIRRMNGPLPVAQRAPFNNRTL